MHIQSLLTGLFLAACAGPICAAAEIPCIALQTDEFRVRGRLLAHDRESCWVVSDDGQLHTVERGSVTDFSTVPGGFRPASIDEISDRLKQEFPRPYHVVSEGRYIVVAEKDVALASLAAFNEIDRAFRTYFAKRVISLDHVEFPLVAIVFRNQTDFMKYAELEGVDARGGLVGYYLRTSNRVALFNPASSDQFATTVETTVPAESGMLTRTPNRTAFRIDAADHLHASLYHTIVHEATHQMAFNSGLHSRVGENPVWIVEGLATMFEADGLRDRSVVRAIENRVNSERLEWFKTHVRPNWKAGRVATLIASDEPFTETPLDAYATAWALTFFLNETRSPEYSRLLRIVKRRDPLQEYTGRQRLHDFGTAIHDDLATIEVEMLRFIDELPSR